MDGGAWWAAVHGVTKSRTRLSNFSFTFHFHALEKEMATHSSVLALRIPGMGEPGGLPSMGRTVGHDWSNLATAAAAWASVKHRSVENQDACNVSVVGQDLLAEKRGRPPWVHWTLEFSDADENRAMAQVSKHGDGRLKIFLKWNYCLYPLKWIMYLTAMDCSRIMDYSF